MDHRTYIDDLKSVAAYHEYSGDEVDTLLKHGFTPEEVEEYIYCNNYPGMKGVI